MGAFWLRVRTLEGRTLDTTQRDKPIAIVEVTDDCIVFVPQDGNGTQRWWSREHLEELNDAISDQGNISPSDLRRHWPDDQDTSYTVATLQAAQTPQADDADV